MVERVHTAAIKAGKKVFSMARPARHSDIYRNFMLTKGDGEEGFTTTEGRFVSRREARRIALKANQLVRPRGHPDKLFTEDLW